MLVYLLIFFMVFTCLHWSFMDSSSLVASEICTLVHCQTDPYKVISFHPPIFHACLSSDRHCTPRPCKVKSLTSKQWYIKWHQNSSWMCPGMWQESSFSVHKTNACGIVGAGPVVYSGDGRGDCSVVQIWGAFMSGLWSSSVGLRKRGASYVRWAPQPVACHFLTRPCHTYESGDAKSREE